MRSNDSHFMMKTPPCLKDALLTLDEFPNEWIPFAGGTDLMVLYETGQLKHTHYLNLRKLPELHGITETDDSISIKSMTTFSQIRANSVLQTEFPNLCRAASETGAIGIQNRGTLGGNIANASPAADSPPALLTYDAELELISKKGARWLSYSEFHLDYKKTKLNPNEIISQIRLPRKQGPRVHYYRKVGTRKAQAISKVCFSGVAECEQDVLVDVRIAIASVAPIPFRCRQTESLLSGKKISQSLILEAKKLMATEIKPIPDIRSTAEYRLKVSQNLLEEFLLEVSKNVGLDLQT